MRIRARLPALTLCLIPLALAPALRGQAAPAAVTQPRPGTADPYAPESIVIEHEDTLYTFNPDGTGTLERTLAARIQSEAAVRALGVVAIPYAGNSEQVEILYARVRRPDGTVVSTDPADALEMPEDVTRQAPFYSDLKQKQIPIRSLHVGDTLEWKARITRTKPEAPGNFWGSESFTDDSVVLSQTIELRVPKSSYVNVWSPTAKPVESTEGDQHIYRWTSSQLKPTVGKQAEAEAEAKKKLVLTPDQELDADQGKLPTIAWTTFKSWQDVGLWYRALSADRTIPSPEIKAKAAELIAGKTTDEEKVRALYAYVSTQFRYIGVSFGVGRYQPHTAAEIMENQYGDCKDKHTLLASLLAAAGFHADAVLIGAGIRFNPDVPSPAAFNHLITHLTLAPAPGQPAQPIWLDTTAEIAPYRMLYAIIRDKQALVIPDPTIPDAAAPHLDRTPADPPFPSFETWDAVGSLDKNGLSHSRLTITFRGDDELAIRSAFRQFSPAHYNQFIQQFLHNLGYQGTTSNPDVTRVDDTAEPLKLAFDYEREKAGDWDNLKIIPQLAPVEFPRFTDKDPQIRSLDLGAPRIEASHAVMKLPDGWTAILPEAVHVKTPYISFDQTYRLDKGTVTTERRIEVLQHKVPVAAVKVYKKWADDADIGNELYIQLVRHEAAATIEIKPDAKTPAPMTILGGRGALPPLSGAPASPANEDARPAITSSAEATQALQDAWSSMLLHKLDDSAKLLDRVKAFNAEQPGLWSMHAALALQRSAPLEAIPDFQKELKLHPEETNLYPALIETQRRLEMRKEVMETLHAWAAADPTNPDPPTQLMSMLVSDGDAGAAVALGQAALPNLGDDPKSGDSKSQEQLRLTLGGALITAGKKAEGKAMLEAVLKDSDNPLSLNDAAYALADASLDLPLAEASTRAALDKLAKESSGWTLDEDPRTLSTQTSLIVATWDTMGWILFREGKLIDAQSYLAAAWQSGQRADIAEHLGELEAARGNKTAAMAYYELAQSKMGSYDSMGVRRPPGPAEKAVQARIDALEKADVKSTIGTADDPHRKLQTMRTFSLRSADGRTGDAEYRILIKDGRVAKSEPMGDKEVDRRHSLRPRKSGQALPRPHPHRPRPLRLPQLPLRRLRPDPPALIGPTAPNRLFIDENCTFRPISTAKSTFCAP